MPVRKVVRRSTVKVVGYHASRKMNCLVPWESQIERDYFEWLEVDPNIIEFHAQPETFQFGTLRYTPDALVTNYQGIFYAEVKPDKISEDPAGLARLSFLEAEFAKHNLRLELVTESVIRRKPLRDNVVSLMRETRRSINPDHFETLAEHLAKGEHSLSLLVARVQGFDVEVLVRRCVSQGLLMVDVKEEITRETMVHLLPQGVV